MSSVATAGRERPAGTPAATPPAKRIMPERGLRFAEALRRLTRGSPASPPERSVEPRTRLDVGVRSEAPRAPRPEPERDRSHDDEGSGDRPPERDLLDPAARHVAQLGPPITQTSAAQAADAPVARAVRSLEDLLPGMVRRIAWAGDGRRGSVRLELGRGSYAGAVVLVHADAGRVRVEVSDVPDAEVLQGRVEARLRARGIEVER